MTLTRDHNLCFIGLDIGTSALKGVLTDAAGKVLAEASAENALRHPHKGWIELDPEAHYRNVCGIVRKLVEAGSPRKSNAVAGERPFSGRGAEQDATAGHAGSIAETGPPQKSNAVVALAMAAASGNTLLTDAEGLPLMNIISWMDERAAQQPPKALTGLTAEAVAKISGWPCVTSFPLAHLAWLKENRPAVLATAAHIGMDTDWLLYRLTGQWRMDHSTATTFHLQDQVAGRYHAPFLERLGVAPEKLSRLVPSGTVVGRLTPQALADTGLSGQAVVVTGCFDHPAAARASGVVDEGQLMLSCGTSWVGFLPHADRRALLEANLLCDPFLSGNGGPWGGMFSVPRIGRTIDWYVEHAIAPGEKTSERMRAFDALAARAPAGAGGLTIDLRQPPHPIDADRTAISRAVMEGVARLLNEKILELARHGLRFHRAVMVGGPSRSPVWPGIVAGMTGLEVITGGQSTGARGAAMLAKEGVEQL